VAQEQHGRFGEGPFEMDIPHLRAAGAEAFAAQLFTTRIPGPIEARDVVNFIQDGER
jgi:hypothetical protein